MAVQSSLKCVLHLQQECGSSLGRVQKEQRRGKLPSHGDKGHLSILTLDVAEVAGVG